MPARKNHADASSTPAIAALRSAGVHFELRAYEHDPDVRSFGAEAAAELGVEPDRVFKTLVVQTDRTADKGLVVAVVPVAGQLDLKALALAIACHRLEVNEALVAVARAVQSTHSVRQLLNDKTLDLCGIWLHRKLEILQKDVGKLVWRDELLVQIPQKHILDAVCLGMKLDADRY